MIKNFADHAANERTFLAWVRTAIAVMAFGFLIERFDLFLHAITPSSVGRNLSAAGERFANAAGLAFIVLGAVMIMIAAAFRDCATDRQRGHSSRDGDPSGHCTGRAARAPWRQPMPISIPRGRRCVLGLLLKFEHELIDGLIWRRLNREVTRVLGMAPEIPLAHELESRAFDLAP
jgi:uncharacterized membrane protein YidH (DUF202 family)